jgi:hypothetical protein
MPLKMRHSKTKKGGIRREKLDRNLVENTEKAVDLARYGFSILLRDRVFSEETDADSLLVS